MDRRSLEGWLIGGMAILVALSNAPAAATLSMQHTYRTGIDVGNDPTTGCDFSLGSVAPNSLPGFELQVTVVVDADLMPPQVVSAEVETCSGDGGSFGGAQPLPGFTLEIDGGLLGSDSIVGAIPRSLLGDAVVVRLAHHAQSGDGSEDALFTRDGTADGAAITAAIGGPAAAPLLSGLGLALAVLLLFGLGFTQWRRGGWGAAAVLIFVASGAVIAYAAFGDPAAVDDPADATPPDSRAEIVASFAMATDSELGLRLDIENIVFVPPTQTPTNTPTQTPTNTPTPNPCAGLADGTTCDAGMDGMVLTCASQTCGACVPTGTCSTTTTTSCAFNEDCPGAETCNVVAPSPRYVDNGDGTITDRQTCLVWEMKTGGAWTPGSNSICPGGANCGDPHHVGNLYQWSSTGTLFDGGAKTLFLDSLNDVGGGGTSCFAGHCDWRLASSGGHPAAPSGERAELESILLMPYFCGSSPCIDPIFGPTAFNPYWSSTTGADDAGFFAWYADFSSTGFVGANTRTDRNDVRAVRGGS